MFACSHWRGSFSHIPCQFAGEDPSSWIVLGTTFEEIENGGQDKKTQTLLTSTFDPITYHLHTETNEFDTMVGEKIETVNQNRAPNIILFTLLGLTSGISPANEGQLTVQSLTINTNIERH